MMPRDSATTPAATLTELSRSERGLGHPLWLASLAVLILNDHFLKRAGLLPGWLTGKLSDFAGLIVAPVLLATIFGARRVGARAASGAFVVVAFVAIKLSPAAAHAVERAFALARVRCRIWCDVTDLFALLVLPAAWWLMARPAPAVWAGPALRRMRERLLVIAGAFACMATSPDIEPYVTIDLSLVNRTSGVQALALYQADPAGLDCAAIEAGNFASLTAATFAMPTCAELAPGKSVRFGTITSVSKGAAPLADGGAGCDAVVIRAAGLADMVLAWPALAQTTTEMDAEKVYLEEAGSRLFVAGTDYVDAAPVAFTLPASGCPGAP